MFERLKKSLVDSFVGAIALGFVFAQGILHFASMFSAPFNGWIMRREYSGFVDHVARSTRFLSSRGIARPDQIGLSLGARVYFAALAVLQTCQQGNARADASSGASRVGCIPPFGILKRFYEKGHFYGFPGS